LVTPQNIEEEPLQNPTFSFSVDDDSDEVIPLEEEAEVPADDTPEATVEEGEEDESPTTDEPPLTASERKRLQELESQQQEGYIKGLETQSLQEAAQIRTEALNRGYAEDTAVEFARMHLESRKREITTIRQLQQYVTQTGQLEEQRRAVAREFKVRASDLNDFDDLKSMRAHARVLARVNRVENTARATRRTPTQTFEGNATERGGAMSDSALLAAIGEGRIDPNRLTQEQTRRLELLLE